MFVNGYLTFTQFIYYIGNKHIGLCSSSAYSVSLPGKYVLVTMDIEKKKVRNWSQEEVATLVDSVLENKEVIQSRHKEADTNLKKK